MAEKVIQEGIRWQHAPHTDTAKCALPVYVPLRPSFSSRLALTAHVSRIPLKYGFTLLLGSMRVCGLDVNPGRSHTNFRTGKRETIWETHWQSWPEIDHVEADDRELTHRQWLREFCRKNRIAFTGGYRAPPHYGGEQLRLF